MRILKKAVAVLMTAAAFFSFSAFKETQVNAAAYPGGLGPAVGYTHMCIPTVRTVGPWRETGYTSNLMLNQWVTYNYERTVFWSCPVCGRICNTEIERGYKECVMYGFWESDIKVY